MAQFFASTSTFQRCNASNVGGAVAIEVAAAEAGPVGAQNCVFQRNNVQSATGTVSGGAVSVQLDDGGNITFTRCTFAACKLSTTTPSSRGTANGGAISIGYNGDTTHTSIAIVGCTFSNAVVSAGWTAGGGGVDVTYKAMAVGAKLSLTDCGFRDTSFCGFVDPFDDN